MFTYKAKCTNVVDGDTVDLRVSLGFGVYFDERFRLAGINTPETYGVKKGSEEYVAGKAATAEVERLILNKEIIVRTEKDKKGKYGRYLAYIYTELDSESPTFPDSCLNDHLVSEGLAEYKEY